MVNTEILSAADHQDRFVFADEQADDCEQVNAPDVPVELPAADQVWKILIVDDEPTVHRATQLALKSFSFLGKPIVFCSAYSGHEAKMLLQGEHADAAVVLLDIVMESHDAGLQVARYVREDLQNHHLRIILRTGHPGDAPEESVILEYDINDYKLKVELTRQRLLTAVIAALRSYRDILTIEQQRQQLAQTLQELQAANQRLQDYSYDLEMRVSQRTAELEAVNSKLQQLAMSDGLTLVANRRHFDKYLQQQWDSLIAQQQPLSLLLCDVDDFKRYNDCYGHLAGDDCLRRIAACLQNILCRPQDMVARFGGEEFAVILPTTSLPGAIKVAKNILRAIHQLRISHNQSSVTDHITLSIGLSCMVPQSELSLATLIGTADRALYQAKQAGRDRYCVDHIATAHVP